MSACYPKKQPALVEVVAKMPQQHQDLAAAILRAWLKYMDSPHRKRG